MSDTPDVVLRKDPERRVRAGAALGRGVAALAVVAATLPTVVVAALLWPSAGPPTTEAAPVAPVTPPSVDFASIRALAQRAPAAAAPAATSIALEPERVGAERMLLKKIARARDARREAGGTLQDLRKPFTPDDLGGAAAMKDLGIVAGRRLLVSRPDLKVVAPAGAALPAGVELASKERDEDVLEADGTLDGKPVHVLRRCVAGELLCVLDIVDGAAAPAAAAADDNAARTLTNAIDAEEAKLKAWTPPPPATPPTTTALAPTRVPPMVGVTLGVLLALLCGGLLAWRIAGVGARIGAAAFRLREVAAGRAPTRNADALAAATPGEIALLERAIDEAAAALVDTAARAELRAQRHARLEVLANAFAAAQEQQHTRVPPDATDDAALAALVDRANALLEKLTQSRG